MPRLSLSLLPLLLLLRPGAAALSGPNFTFSYRVRVASFNPAIENNNVTTAWSWFRDAQPFPGEQLTGSQWSANYTFNNTGVSWEKISTVDYKILPSYIRLCPIGQPLLANCTMAVQVSVAVSGGRPNLLEATLLRGQSISGKIPRQYRRDCAVLQVIIGHRTSTATNFVETSRQYNARRYWPTFAALPVHSAPAVQLFPIQDRLAIADGDIDAWRDAVGG